MQTPAAAYAPSPRPYPARVPEPEYPSAMLVRSVHHQGQIRWKKHDVVVSQVLWGERVGLLPVDERWFTIYFAQSAIACLIASGPSDGTGSSGGCGGGIRRTFWASYDMYVHRVQLREAAGAKRCAAGEVNTIPRKGARKNHGPCAHPRLWNFPTE